MGTLTCFINQGISLKNSKMVIHALPNIGRRLISNKTMTAPPVACNIYVSSGRSKHSSWLLNVLENAQVRNICRQIDQKIHHDSEECLSVVYSFLSCIIIHDAGTMPFSTPRS
jgi:hypothetical protein